MCDVHRTSNVRIIESRSCIILTVLGEKPEIVDHNYFVEECIRPCLGAAGLEGRHPKAHLSSITTDLA